MCSCGIFLRILKKNVLWSCVGILKKRKKMSFLPLLLLFERQWGGTKKENGA